MNTKILKKEGLSNSEGGPQLELRRRIEQRAHGLWVEGGRPEGMALSHWLQAEREVSAQVQPTGQKSPARGINRAPRSEKNQNQAAS